jgi:hypothetical protein
LASLAYWLASTVTTVCFSTHRIWFDAGTNTGFTTSSTKQTSFWLFNHFKFGVSIVYS